MTGRSTPDDWTVVEVISALGMSVISQGGRSKEWTSVDRLAPSHIPVRKIIQGVVDTGTTADLSFTSKKGTVDRVIVHPITSPREAVYGVQFWRGPDGTQPPEKRRITGVFWDLQRRVVVQPWESTWMSGREDDYHEEIPLARVLQLGTRYDQFSETLQLLFEPETGQKTQTSVTIVHNKTGERLTWRINIVADPPRGVKVLWEDITDVDPPKTPTLHQVGMEAAAAAGLTVAVIAPSVGTIALFLTPPPSWLPWDEPTPGIKIIHPDDQQKMLAFLGSEMFGRAAADSTLSVRLLTTTGDWVPVEMSLTPIPGAIGSGTVVATFPTPREVR